MSTSRERIYDIVNKDLGTRKLSARWVPRLVTFERVRMNVTERVIFNALLVQFWRNKSEFCRRLIFMKTWWNKYNQNSAVRREIGSKKAKIVLTTEKVMATVFGIVVELS